MSARPGGIGSLRIAGCRAGGSQPGGCISVEATQPPARFRAHPLHPCPTLGTAGYLFGQFKRITGMYTASLTGKG